jgi:peptide/nickel transport system substrate-binding protein
MKKIRWQLIIIFFTGIVVGILLLGEQPSAQPNATLEPVKGGVYTEALIGSVQRLNPIMDSNNPVDRDINRLIYSSLIRFDERGNPVLDMVESWGVSKDGTIYNISLRGNMFWHDGQKVTSADVLFTIDLMRNGGKAISEDIQTLWNDVQVKSLNDTTLQFQLPEPYAPFMDYLSFGVLPRHLLEGIPPDQIADAEFNLKPIGSGPFRFERWLTSENGQISGIVLQAFTKYYATQKPYIEQLVFRFYPDDITALQAYRDGNVQGIGTVTIETLKDVLAEPELALYTARKPELSILFLNLNDPELPFFKDSKVRRALFSGINRQWIIDRILNGQAYFANGPIFPGTWAYFDGIKGVMYDSDYAIKLLKEAGYVFTGDDQTVRKKDDIPLSFTLLYPDDAIHRLIAEALQRDWAKLNVVVYLEALPYEGMIQTRLGQRQYQAALVDINLARLPDPDPYPFWDQAQATGGQNYSQWDNRIASEYLEQARITINQTERARLYRNFQVVFDDEMPAFPLYYPVYNYAVDRQILGVQIGPLFDTSDRFGSILHWFLAIRRPTPQITVTQLP